MFWEFSCRPLVRQWVQPMVSLWNRVVDMPASSLLRITLEEGLVFAGVPSWYRCFSTIMDNIGAMPAAGLCPAGTPAAL